MLTPNYPWSARLMRFRVWRELVHRLDRRFDWAWLELAYQYDSRLLDDVAFRVDAAEFDAEARRFFAEEGRRG